MAKSNPETEANVPYRKLDMRFWADEKVMRLSRQKASAQALFLYLILGPQNTSVPGLYKASQGRLADELGWSPKDFRRCWAEIEALGMALADWGAHVVYIPKAVQYNLPPNPNVVRHWRRLLLEVPHCPLKQQACEAIARYVAQEKIEDRTKGDGQNWRQALQFAFGETVIDSIQETVTPTARQTVPETVPETSSSSSSSKQYEEKTTPPPPDADGNEVVEESPSSPTPAEFLEVWNSATEFRSAREMTDKRLTAYRARCKDPDWASSWQAALERARRSAFCRGKSKSEWIADVDWFLRPDTVTKILEGKYDDRRAGNGSHAAQGADFFAGLHEFVQRGTS